MNWKIFSHQKKIKLSIGFLLILISMLGGKWRKEMDLVLLNCNIEIQNFNLNFKIDIFNRRIYLNYYINIYILLKIIIEDIDIYEYDRYFFLWVAIGYEQGS